MDLNGDGNVDILSGSYSRHEKEMAGLFQVLWGNEDGTFNKAKGLEGTDGELLIIPQDGRMGVVDAICTRPTAADIDADGHLDIVSGNFAGTFCWFRGEGEGKFSPTPAWILTPDGDRLKVSQHSDPFLVDWDKDGDLDMLSGSSSGGVNLIPNIGSKTEPQFAKPIALVKAHEGSGKTVFGDEHITAPQGSTRVFATDVNGDGKLDLLIGDSTRLVFPADGLSEEEARTAMEEWDAKSAEISKSAPKITDYENMTDEQEKAMDEYSERFSELYEQRSKFIKEEATGFVWLMLQK